MKIQFVKLIALLGIATLLTTSCTSWRISRATAELQVVEGSQNDWGKIAVSDLNFAPNKGQFNINFNEDVTNYVQAARSNINGKASSSEQNALYIGALAQGMFTPPISTGSPSNSTYPPSQISMPNQAQTAVNNFSQPPSLNALNPTTDERDAVEKGIYDKITEFFLKFMANPDVNSNQEAIVFGVTQATCQPGAFTRKGYVAELDVYLKYGRMNNGQVEVQLNTVPGILEVLPLIDSRNMQLQNSYQQQIEVALALSAAFSAKGMNAAAHML
jgi:hypothetical protein